LPSIQEALGSIPSTAKKKKEKEGREGGKEGRREGKQEGGKGGKKKELRHARRETHTTDVMTDTVIDSHMGAHTHTGSEAQDLLLLTCNFRAKVLPALDPCPSILVCPLPSPPLSSWPFQPLGLPWFLFWAPPPFLCLLYHRTPCLPPIFSL
jgi:hypothetical protein